MLDELRGHDAILLGAIGDPSVPPGVLERGLLLALRFALDHHVNLRPVKLYPGVRGPLGDQPIDMVVVREGTEGPYVGNGGTMRTGTPHEIATEVSLNTAYGVERVVRDAFARAQARDGRLTLVHKTNVLVHAGGLWKRTADRVGEEFPDVRVEYQHADAASMFFVTDPGRFDVVVTDNLFGDILTDIGAAICGGIGLAASGNLDVSRTNPSMFEPVHGSAPDIAGHGDGRPDRDRAVGGDAAGPPRARERGRAGRGGGGRRPRRPRQPTRGDRRGRRRPARPAGLTRPPPRGASVRAEGPAARRHGREDAMTGPRPRRDATGTEAIEVVLSDARRSAAERAALMADPGLRAGPHRPHGDGALDAGPRLARGAGCRPTRRCSSTRRRWCCTTARRSSRGSRPTASPTAGVAVFRPEENARRFNRSATRLAMPELPEELFVAAVEALVGVDADWVPTAAGQSLYLRPFMIATEAQVGMRPAHEYLFLLIAFPVTPFFPGEVRPVTVWLSVGVRPGGGRRHRRGQVRRQLRRQPARPAAGRREGLRPGGLARRGGAPLGRGDGRDEPVLRLPGGRPDPAAHARR